MAARYVDFLKAQLGQTEARLQDARSKNEAVRQAVYAQFGIKLASVIDAAKKRAVQVIDDARRQAQASLTAAREEAGETVAAARREASRIRDEAEREGRNWVAAANEAAMRARMNAERILREEDQTLREIQVTAEGLLDRVTSVRQNLLPELSQMRERLADIGEQLEETIRRPFSEGPETQPDLQLTPPAPARGGSLIPTKGADPDAEAATIGAGTSVGYGHFDVDGESAGRIAPNGGNGFTTEPIGLEDFDDRWLDELWRKA